jgi:hypothetical protein
LQAAERAFIRNQQKADAPRATTDYRAGEQAVRDRTAKLREERLAREAAAKKPTTPKKPNKPK